MCGDGCAHAVAAGDSDSVVALAEAAAVLLQWPAPDPTHSDRQDPFAFRVLLLLDFHQAHYQHWDLRLVRVVEVPLVVVAVVDVKMAVLAVAAVVVSY